MVIIGVDPGKKGGIAVIGENKEIISLTPMPLIGGKTIDANALANLFEVADSVMYIEKVNAMPKQGVVSMFNFGFGCGLIEGIAAAFSIPYYKITPQTWMKIMHRGCDGKLDTKSRSIQVVKRQFPNLSLLATPRSKKDHDGMAEALLIALYGLGQERPE